MYAHNIDVTELREVENQLRTKRQKLEEMDESYRILSRTFELSQVPIGKAH